MSELCPSFRKDGNDSFILNYSKIFLRLPPSILGIPFPKSARRNSLPQADIVASKVNINL
jgi:hypothetical protein